MFFLSNYFELPLNNMTQFYTFPAVSAQIVIYLALFVCGLTVPHAGEVVQVWPENVVAWEVLVKQGFQSYL